MLVDLLLVVNVCGTIFIFLLLLVNLTLLLEIIKEAGRDPSYVGTHCHISFFFPWLYSP
jgi:hypothetical protein